MWCAAAEADVKLSQTEKQIGEQEGPNVIGGKGHFQVVSSDFSG